MPSSMIRHQWIPIAVLSIIVLFGALLRLDNLDKATISHGETYVPGIELPEKLSVAPAPRLTLAKTVKDTIHWDVHPPTYYVLMFGWTKWFGTGMFSLRLPALLFGVASILLIYFLCVLKGDKLTGLLAAGMLAFNGTHIYWSQTARMYSMGCFLGLLSTIFLLLIIEGRTRQRIFQFLYFGVTFTGLTTVIYFWPIFATHTLWSLWSNRSKDVSVPSLLRLQMFILILASPLLAVAIHQSRYRAAYISNENLWTNFSQFLQFGFAFQPGSIPAFMAVFLVFVALFLLIVGLMSKAKPTRENMIAIEPSSVVMVAAGVLVFLGILLFAKSAHEFASQYSRNAQLIVVSSAIPLLIPLTDFVIRRYWDRLQKLRIFVNERVSLLCYLSPLDVLLAIVPAAIIVGLSLFVTPLFASRGVLLFIPYFVIILCKGLVLLLRRHLLWVFLVLILVVVHVFSLANYKYGYSSDYKALAEQWVSKIDESDLIFVQPHWATTPIFYYLKGDSYHFIGRKYLEEIRQYSDSRAWVLSVVEPDLSMTEEMANALEGYQPVERIGALNLQTVLYTRDSQPSP